jgi:nicotinamidase-related amidase
MYTFTLKRQKIVLREGFRVWEPSEETVRYEPPEVAVVIVDMWDQHWSAGATFRGGVLAEKINAVAVRARERGALIVHAPSDTMDAYAGTEARNRFLAVKKPDGLPPPLNIEDYPSPIDASGGGSDTVDRYTPNTRVWKRQTDKIRIDQSRDLICGDEGEQLYACFLAAGIKFAVYMGVHTNMCILGRSFAIKSMLSRGLKVALIRDLTDAMYDPEKPPYVSHEEGTRLVVEFIEKKYCPTIDSGQL